MLFVSVSEPCRNGVRKTLLLFMYNTNMTDNIYNILIVEDEWINAEFLSDLIHSFGHKVVGVASSAKDALEILSSKSCDLIFMDINIKGPTDGIQLAKKLNQKQEIPIVFITAFADSVTIEDASETNIYGFVVKPFNASHIEAVLNVAIARIKKEQKQTDVIPTMEKSQLDLGQGYHYNFQREAIYFKKKPIHLSKNESKILFLLCSSFGHVLSCEKMRSHVWGEKNVTESTIRDTILRVRKKIPHLSLLNTVGVGYSLTNEQQ